VAISNLVRITVMLVATAAINRSSRVTISFNKASSMLPALSHLD